MTRETQRRSRGEMFGRVFAILCLVLLALGTATGLTAHPWRSQDLRKRIIFTIVIAKVMGLPYLKLVGGLALIVIARRDGGMNGAVLLASRKGCIGRADREDGHRPGGVRGDQQAVGRAGAVVGDRRRDCVSG